MRPLNIDKIGEQIVAVNNKTSKDDKEVKALEDNILAYCSKPRTSSEILQLFAGRVNIGIWKILHNLVKEGRLNSVTNKYITDIRYREIEPVMAINAEKEVSGARKVVKEYDVYSFDELSPDAKEKALKELRDINVEDIVWYDVIIEDWKAKLSEAGWGDPKDIEIAFRGFWSQGDGASFTNERLDTNNIVKLIETYNLGDKYPLVKAVEYLSGSITRSGNYSHERSTTLKIYGDPEEGMDADTFYKQLNDLEKDLGEIMIGLNEEIYKDLEEEYEAATTDAAVEETIKANDFQFLADGSVFEE